LGHRKSGCGIATQFAAIGFDDVGFRVDLDFGQRVVPEQIVFGNVARVFNRAEPFAEAERGKRAFAEGDVADERQACGVTRFAVGRKLRPVKGGLGVGNTGVRVAHIGRSDQAAFEDELGFHPEKRGFPDHQIREFANLDRADFMGDPMR